MTDLEYRKKINTLQKEREELLILIDTAQSALRRAEGTLQGQDYKYVFSKAAKWVLEWKK